MYGVADMAMCKPFWAYTRLAGIMLQIFIIILFQISLKISSLWSILFVLCLWLDHHFPFTSKLLSTFSYVHLKYSIQIFSSHSTTALSMVYLLTSPKSLPFTASNIVPEVEISFFLSGSLFYSKLLCSIFCSKFQYFAKS